jgi:hypothetical protein
MRMKPVRYADETLSRQACRCWLTGISDDEKASGKFLPHRWTSVDAGFCLCLWCPECGLNLIRYQVASPSSEGGRRMEQYWRVRGVSQRRMPIPERGRLRLWWDRLRGRGDYFGM